MQMKVRVELPGSKSEAARALVCRFVRRRLGRGDVELRNLPECGDTLALRDALLQLECAAPGVLTDYYLGEGGTSLRFFLGMAASCEGMVSRIDCADALRRRPLSPLVDALRVLGADIRYTEEDGRAPLLVNGKTLLADSAVRVDGSVSSQFASSLLLASPLWRGAGEVLVDGCVSRPYVGMTREVMQRMESLPEGGAVYEIEPDWSAASYFYEWNLLYPEVEAVLPAMRMGNDSLQGDSVCAEIFAAIGGFNGAGSGLFERDMNATPDLVPALVVGCCVSGMPFRFTGVAHLRHKESDRLAALQTEMAKTAYRLHVGADSICWDGRLGKRLEDWILFDAHGDHRMAMALSVAAPRIGNCEVMGMECVSKSFPGFEDELKKLTRALDSCKRD